MTNGNLVFRRHCEHDMMTFILHTSSHIRYHTWNSSILQRERIRIWLSWVREDTEDSSINQSQTVESFSHASPFSHNTCTRHRSFTLSLSRSLALSERWQKTYHSISVITSSQHSCIHAASTYHTRTQSSTHMHDSGVTYEMWPKQSQLFHRQLFNFIWNTTNSRQFTRRPPLLAALRTKAQLNDNLYSPLTGSINKTHKDTKQLNLELCFQIKILQ